MAEVVSVVPLVHDEQIVDISFLQFFGRDRW